MKLVAHWKSLYDDMDTIFKQSRYLFIIIPCDGL